MPHAFRALRDYPRSSCVWSSGVPWTASLSQTRDVRSQPVGGATMAITSHLTWSGAMRPAADPATFSRDLTVSFAGTALPMSAAPDFRGDPLKANPEQLFVASLSACQALTYLFLAARKGLAVVAYGDDAEGILAAENGVMRMSRVTLRPRITIAEGSSESLARELVAKAHTRCFIANSISAAVELAPTIEVAALCQESA